MCRGTDPVDRSSTSTCRPGCPAGRCSTPPGSRSCRRGRRRRLGAITRRRRWPAAWWRSPSTASAPTPSCSTRPAAAGAFLVAAAEHLDGGTLIGYDIDPLAVATTAAALTHSGTELRSEPATRKHARIRAQAGGRFEVVVGDALAMDGRGRRRLPSSATRRSSRRWVPRRPVGQPPDAMRRRLGAPYADVAGLFLVRALAHRRVVLLQPESLLSAQDAAPIHMGTRSRPRLHGLWVARRADVRGVGAGMRARRPRGAARDGAPLAGRRRPARRSGRPHHHLNRLRPDSAPRVQPGTRRLGDLATATAGFRDEFYGLAAVVQESAPVTPSSPAGSSILGRIRWGERPARIAKRRYERPTVDPAAIAGVSAAGPGSRPGWCPRSSSPPQTRSLEAAADPEGRCTLDDARRCSPPSAPRPGRRRGRWAAALTSPVVSAWARAAVRRRCPSAEAALKSQRLRLLAGRCRTTTQAWATASAAPGGAGGVRLRVGAGRGDQRFFSWWTGPCSMGS